MKGVTLGQIPQVIMIILIIGILTGAFYIALESFQGTQYIATTVTNESKTLNNYTQATFTNAFVTSVTRVGNNTLTLGSGNYSIINTAYHTYTLLPTFSTGIANGTYNVSYVYSLDSKSTTGIGYTISMMDNIVNNYGVVGIMIFVGILVTVVFWMVASGKFGKKESGGA